jgi:hypothetical protein
MTDITLPYDEDTISGSFSYDITNNQDYITVITDGFSAGTIAFVTMDGTTERAIPGATYTTNIGDVIGPLRARNIRVVGTGVTANYLSIA